VRFGGGGQRGAGARGGRAPRTCAASERSHAPFPRPPPPPPLLPPRRLLHLSLPLSAMSVLTYMGRTITLAQVRGLQ
jgi:hypothetical protein